MASGIADGIPSSTLRRFNGLVLLELIAYDAEMDLDV
jgi:hypothetical protein